MLSMLNKKQKGILARAEAIIEEKRYRKTCRDAEICNECGAPLYRRSIQRNSHDLGSQLGSLRPAVLYCPEHGNQ